MRGIHHHISYLILNYEIEFFVRLYLRTSPQPPFKCIGLAVGSLGYKYNKGEHLKGGWGKFSPGIPPPTRYKKFCFVIQGNWVQCFVVARTKCERLLSYFAPR